jgi:hypothetical protein
MTVLMTIDLPISAEVLGAVSQEMGVRQNPPDGLIVHVTTETPQGCHIVDVWDSSELYEKFRDSRLMPAMGKIMSERGMAVPDSPPEAQYAEALDLVRGR